MKIFKKFRDTFINSIENLRDDWQIKEIQKNPENIFYIEKPSEQVLIALVNKNPDYLRYIQESHPDKLTEAIQIAAVQKDPSMIEYIINPSKKVQSTAIFNDTKFNGIDKTLKNESFLSTGLENEIPKNSLKSATEKEISSIGSRSLIQEVSTNQDTKTNIFRIRDYTTGKTEILYTKGIDLSKESPETIKKILSGGKANTRGGIIQLSKNKFGWQLKAIKQAITTTDSSAEL